MEETSCRYAKIYQHRVKRHATRTNTEARKTEVYEQILRLVFLHISHKPM